MSPCCQDLAYQCCVKHLKLNKNKSFLIVKIHAINYFSHHCSLFHQTFNSGQNIQNKSVVIPYYLCMHFCLHLSVVIIYISIFVFQAFTAWPFIPPILSKSCRHRGWKVIRIYSKCHGCDLMQGCTAERWWVDWNLCKLYFEGVFHYGSATCFEW